MSHFLSYKSLTGLLEAPLVWQRKSSLFFEFLSLQVSNLASSHDIHPSRGFVLYRLEKLLAKGTVVRIDSDEVKDYALVMCNLNETLLVVDNLNGVGKRMVELTLAENCEYFDILVESMGRNSDVGGSLRLSLQRKGLLYLLLVEFFHFSNI